MDQHKKVSVGIIGCGSISSNYLRNLTTLFKDSVTVAAVSDVRLERAKEQAAKYGIAKAYAVPELLAVPSIELVLNLTIPQAHFEVSMAAVESGKSVYVEKPLCVSREEAAKLLKFAASKNARVGCAPDIFLGAGQQTSRKLLDDGVIGFPVSATAMILFRGHESWHPDPEFYYKAGGGPLFDMGVYNLTALVALLGPVKRVSGMARTTFAERVITSEPKKGQRIKVDVPTHLAGNLEFHNGTIGSVIASFDVYGTRIPRMELHGSEGTLVIPEDYGAPPILYRPGKEDWAKLPLTHAHTEESRGLGVADMAGALRSGRPHRANGEFAAHVLEIMIALHDSAAAGRAIDLLTTCTRPDALPPLSP